MTCLTTFIFIICTRVGEGVKLHQQSYIRHAQKILTFVLLTKVLKTLDEYISRTECWGSGLECSQLLIHINQ